MKNRTYHSTIESNAGYIKRPAGHRRLKVRVPQAGVVAKESPFV